jgi:1,4-dihydroxy-2-naphthoate octaprenyltransferase
VKSLRDLNTKKARKWLWITLGAAAALQVYFVRELMAALFLFSVVFVIVAVAALVFYLFDQVSLWTMDWAEPQTLRAARLARKAFTRAEEVSKKQLHRLRSEIAR